LSFPLLASPPLPQRAAVEFFAGTALETSRFTFVSIHAEIEDEGPTVPLIRLTVLQRTAKLQAID
jgi:hypothetical protein